MTKLEGHITHLTAIRQPNLDISINLDLSWGYDAVGATADHTIVRWTGDDGYDGHAVLSGAQTAYTIRGADPNQSYEITVGLYRDALAEATVKSEASS